VFGWSSTCWARTKDHRGQASIPNRGDGRSRGQPLARAPSSVVPARVPSHGAAPPMLYSLWWRRCPLGQQGCVPAQCATLALLCRAVAKLMVNPLSFLPFKCTLPSSGTRSTRPEPCLTWFLLISGLWSPKFISELVDSVDCLEIGNSPLLPYKLMACSQRPNPLSVDCCIRLLPCCRTYVFPCELVAPCWVMCSVVVIGWNVIPMKCFW